MFIRLFQLITQPVFILRACFIVLIGLVCVLSPAAFAKNREQVPNLPREIQGVSSQPVLLEFYASWCSTCQKMFPHVSTMKKRTRGKLQVIRMDIDDPKNKPWVSLYGIDGTPTYLLFNADKAPVYVMEDMISSKILETMVYREANLLATADIPAPLEDRIISSKPLTFIAYHKKDCDTCQYGRAFGDALKKEYPQAIHFVELNHDEQSVQTLSKQMPVKRIPAYVLMDRSGHPLHTLNAPLNKRNQLLLLKIIDLMAQGMVQP